MTETTWNAWGDTDPGKQRSNNEDRIYCDARRGIFIVADGMGGEAAGEVAAQQAIDFMKKRLGQETGTVARRLREAIAGANNEIYRLAQTNPQWRGMACVLTAVVEDDGDLHVGHVGDTRLYKIRDGRITKITSDHSPIGQREEAGELTEAEAMRHPRRNEVFRDVGSREHKPDDEGFVEYARLPFEADSALVLCSDGLSDMVTSSAILSAALRNAGSPRDCVRELIAEANAAGGKDNISVIVVEGSDFPAQAQAADGRAIPSGATVMAAGRRLAARRFFYLAIGLLAGLLASNLWTRYGSVWFGPDAPQPEIPPAPRVLTVEPASPEYPSIGMALENARPGDRIRIADGEYQESIRLKPGVDIAAVNPGKAIIHISRPLPGTDSAIVAEGISGVTLSGISVRAEAAAALPYGVRITDSDIVVSLVEISGAVQTGVLINGRSRSTLAGCLIRGNAGPGIAVAGTASPFLTGNIIHGNGITRQRAAPGLYVTENALPEAVRNIFSGNGAEAIRVQRQDLRDKMLNNLFAGPAPNKVGVERTKK